MNRKLFLIALLMVPQFVLPAASSSRNVVPKKARQTLVVTSPQGQRVAVTSPLLKEFYQDPVGFDASIQATIGQSDYKERLLKSQAFLKEVQTSGVDMQNTMLFALDGEAHYIFDLLMFIPELKNCVLRKITVPGIRKKPIDVYITPVMEAVQSNKPKQLALMLNAGADPNGMCSQGVTPLIQAIASHKNELAYILLERGADARITRNDGASSLHIAASTGNIAIIPALLRAGVDINKQDDGGYSALSVAVQKGREEEVRLLLAEGAEPNISSDNKISPLHAAIQGKNINIIRALVLAGASVNQQDNRGCSPLYLAVEAGLYEEVLLFLEKKADPNLLRNDGASPLAFAVQDGRDDIAKALLLAGAHPNTGLPKGCSALHMAAQKGYDSMVQLLLEHGANYTDVRFDEAVNEPLVAAIVQGYINIIQRLLTLDNIPLFVRTDNNMSIWHFLGLSNCADMKRMIALFEPYEDRLPGLHMQDAFGCYPIHYAGCRFDVDLLQFMLARGVDIHVSNRYKETPLYIAALTGNLLAVQILCKAGANTQAKNILNLKPIDIAQIEGHKDVVAFLQQYKPSTTVAASSVESPSQASDLEQNIPSQEQDAISSSAQKKQAGSQVTKAKGKRKNRRGQPVAIDDAFTVIDVHKEQDTKEIFALRQPEQHMTVVVYKGATYKLPRLSNLCNMSKKTDNFHAFSARVDRYLDCGIYIDAGNWAQHEALLANLGIDDVRGFAILLPGKIESESYNARYAAVDRGLATRGRAGAFVYLFEKSGKCYHRCFHENRDSKQRYILNQG